jgi:hypothetical protein
LTENELFDEEDLTIKFFNFTESKNVSVTIELIDSEEKTSSYETTFIVQIYQLSNQEEEMNNTS